MRAASSPAGTAPPGAAPLAPGKLIGPQAFLGRGDFGKDIGEIVMVNGYNGSRFLLTADGLWIGHVGNDTRNGPENMPKTIPEPGYIMDNVSFGGESFCGSFTRTADGRAYTLSGLTDPRVVEVKGLDSIRRLDGRVAIQLQFAPQQFRAIRAVHEQPRGLVATRNIHRPARRIPV